VGAAAGVAVGVGVFVWLRFMFGRFHPPPAWAGAAAWVGAAAGVAVGVGVFAGFLKSRFGRFQASRRAAGARRERRERADARSAVAAIAPPARPKPTLDDEDGAGAVADSWPTRAGLVPPTTSDSTEGCCGCEREGWAKAVIVAGPIAIVERSLPT